VLRKRDDVSVGRRTFRGQRHFGRVARRRTSARDRTTRA
jgi:hypothetical protein